MGTDLAKNPVQKIKLYMSAESVKKRFEEMLGERAGAFMNSIINIVRNSNALQKCVPESTISAAFVAATLNLPIDAALGQAAIVPYGNSAQFQIMYRGVIQLCIRSNQYETIHCSEIYRDELKSHNPITGVVKFHDPETFKMRDEGKLGDVVGHYACFKLIAGFEKSDFMSHEQAMAHGKKYSKAYQYDLSANKKACPWSTDPVAMCNKTVLLRLLKKWGVMSIEMQTAIVKDSSFEAAEDAAGKQIDAEMGSEPVSETEEAKPKAKKTRKKKVKSEEVTPEAKPDEQVKFNYICKGCGLGFDEPKISGSGETLAEICPHCLSQKIKAVE